ncbi:MAG TPA: nodulation protein NfeD [Myxococcaceae bacterium]|nr:nodulation protein NfeD [Myxococcaceae bacterium]
MGIRGFTAFAFGPPLRFYGACAGLLLCAAETPPGKEPAARATIARCELTGTVDSGSAAYLLDCVRRAEQAPSEALLVRVDTPGGSLDATREIVGAFLGSKVPVLVWVGPAGAHAGSAGVFITLAGNVAAMAPGTNIGAAHPVEGMGGKDPEANGKQMARKIENDTAAFAESIAHQRGRNEAWAIEAVRESTSLTAENAVKQKVVDFLAATEADLLERCEGRKTALPGGERVLHTRGAAVVSWGATLGQRFVHLLSSPTIAYLLFLLGGLGLVIELSHPGMYAPGIVGLCCMVLALVAFSALPIRVGAVILLFLGVAMIFAELFVSHGVLAVGGSVLLALGGIMLIDRFNPRWYVEPSFGLPISWVLPTAAVIGGGACFVVFKAAQARRLPQRGGDAGLVGEVGMALTQITSQGGEVFVHGERWRAVSTRDIPDATAVIVRGVNGLTLNVEEQ